MCGRYSLGVPHAEVQQLHGYNVHVGEWVGQDDFVPRHNIAPRSQAPVLRRREPNELEEAGEDTSSAPLILQTMKWGLVPHWSKHEDKSMNTTNARSENLVERGGMWASIKGRKRCAVVCEGYFEWLKKGKNRFPHFTKHKSGNLMLLAGLYDRAVLEGTVVDLHRSRHRSRSLDETRALWTFTIVTTVANKEFEWLHDRQPVILSTLGALNTWLDTSSLQWTPALTKLVDPYNDSNSPLLCYQVPKEVGKVGTESPTFVQPISERKDGIQAMFAKQKDTSSQVSRKRRRGEKPPKKNTESVKDAADASSSMQKVNVWEDDSEVEYIGTTRPSTPKIAASEKPNIDGDGEVSTSSPIKRPRVKGRSAKANLTLRSGAAGPPQGSNKITSFFAKT
ncbi:uncharacterized protein FIBRA_05348 [Fibroporia radiculosa]|uniref:DUF159-domain-containing protein n=1 Tax=Fibroporia radiculosa TaxID=599839 RepID=J4G960_9APHY|nr:uncharacterized protein FIBRA_05348 [Fibroporia radiculosa]CCM03223.1 predicted protein [Fibroporia radiculosa]